MSIRFRVCRSCHARCHPSEGRYCYTHKLPGFDRSDFICNECRSKIASEQRQGKSAPPPPVSSLPPAGWHRDPHGVANERWWDGANWTEHVR